jgi:hypothetical protein
VNESVPKGKMESKNNCLLNKVSLDKEKEKRDVPEAPVETAQLIQK